MRHFERVLGFSGGEISENWTSMIFIGTVIVSVNSVIFEITLKFGKKVITNMTMLWKTGMGKRAIFDMHEGLGCN